MHIDYDRLLRLPPKEEDVTYTARDTILYHLGIGFGFEPMDKRQLPFTYETQLRAFPTIAMAIGHPGFWLQPAGLDPRRIVHAEKRMEVIAPMPAEGTVHTRSVVTGATDKGPGKSALIHTQRDIWDKKTGAHLSRQINTMMARGQGGFGGPAQAPSAPHEIPDRPPDESSELPTVPQQALIFRLSGDRHPLHVDPDFVRLAGFDHTILHGLANMAIATHAVVRKVFDYDETRIRTVQCRFTKPVFPGDVIATDIWRDAGGISFRSRVKKRDVVVVDHGLIEIDQPRQTAVSA
jgi:acyl dehydratase